MLSGSFHKSQMPGFFKPGKALFDSDNHDARHVALQRRGAAGCSSRESNKDSSSWPRRGVALGGHGVFLFFQSFVRGFTCDFSANFIVIQITLPQLICTRFGVTVTFSRPSEIPLGVPGQPPIPRS